MHSYLSKIKPTKSPQVKGRSQQGHVLFIGNRGKEDNNKAERINKLPLKPANSRYKERGKTEGREGSTACKKYRDATGGVIKQHSVRAYARSTTALPKRQRPPKPTSRRREANHTVGSGFSRPPGADSNAFEQRPALNAVGGMRAAGRSGQVLRATG